MRSLAFPLLALVALASPACDGSSTSTPSGVRGPDLSTPEVVLAQALDRARAGDLPGFDAFLTPGCAERVRRDLAAWRAALVDPTQGPRVLSRIPKPATPEDAAVRDRALAGDSASLFRLLTVADPPRGVAPAAPTEASAAPAAPPTWAELRYESSDGSLRRVVLVRSADGWRIEQYQL